MHSIQFFLVYPSAQMWGHKSSIFFFFLVPSLNRFWSFSVFRASGPSLGQVRTQGLVGLCHNCPYQLPAPRRLRRRYTSTSAAGCWPCDCALCQPPSALQQLVCPFTSSEGAQPLGRCTCCTEAVCQADICADWLQPRCSQRSGAKCSIPHELHNDLGWTLHNCIYDLVKVAFRDGHGSDGWLVIEHADF
jgi:hypothetical protein